MEVGFQATADQRQKEIQIQQLFLSMQNAERNKDVDPVAYQTARIAYNRAANGSKWMDEEQDKLRKEADIQLAQWRNQYKNLQLLRDTRRENLDAVRTAEASQDSLAEDLSYATTELKRLIQKDHDASLLKEREGSLRTSQAGLPPWAVTSLDALLVVLLLLAIWMLYGFLGQRWDAAYQLLAYQNARTIASKLIPTLGPTAPYGIPGRQLF